MVGVLEYPQNYKKNFFSRLLNVILYAAPLGWANDFIFIGEKYGQIWANSETVFFNTIHILLGVVALNRMSAILGNIIDLRQ